MLLDENEQQISTTKFGQVITLRYFVKAYENIHHLSFAFHIRDKNGVELIYDDTILQNCPIISVCSEEIFILDWKFCINLQKGNYNIAAMMSIPVNLDVSEVDICDFIPIAAQFNVETSKYIYAATCANSELTINRK